MQRRNKEKKKDIEKQCLKIWKCDSYRRQIRIVQHTDNWGLHLEKSKHWNKINTKIYN